MDNMNPFPFSPLPFKGRVRVGMGLLLFLPFLHNHPYFLCHCFSIFKGLIIPESQNMKAGGFKFLCTVTIIFSLFSVLTAVKFNNQFDLQTDKIKDVIVKWMLTAKLDS